MLTKRADENKLEIIKRIILSHIRNKEAKDRFIANSVIKYKENIHLYLPAIAHQLRLRRVEIKSRKELGGLFRILGFINKTVRIRGRIYRTWQINEKQLLRF